MWLFAHWGMELVLLLAAVTLLLMALAFLTLPREDRELAREALGRLPDGPRPAWTEQAQ